MATTPTALVTCPQLCRTSTCPSWLQAALADIEQRVNEVVLTQPAVDNSDSFADRAEFYYEKRPQLVSLLHDLHHRYLQLADRYSQSLRRTHSPSPSISPPDSPTSSAAESALSFQPNNLNPNPNLNPIEADLDFLIAELVITGVEREILVNEINESDRYRMEADRRMELQRSLVEVLESEREVLAGENARLGFRAAAAEAEARGLAAEVGWMRRRAGELARAVVKLREDHRVCLLSRRIEGLQAQIYALERRNGECYEAMKKREVEKGAEREELERLKEENRRLKEEVRGRRMRRKGGRRGWEKVGRWWAQARKGEWAPFVLLTWRRAWVWGVIVGDFCGLVGNFVLYGGRLCFGG
ncbi:putative protein Networked (NET), actin-binding (NAB) [Dioscorea sansibarensis]